MITKCNKCKLHYDDEFRWTICPHNTFAANDGLNNFRHHRKSYLESDETTDKHYKAPLYERKR